MIIKKKNEKKILITHSFIMNIATLCTEVTPLSVEYKSSKETVYIKLTSIYDPYGEVYERLL